MYPVVFFDALRVTIRDEATVRSKAVSLALGVLPDGSRDILGIWIEQTEDAKFWMKIFSDLKSRAPASALSIGTLDRHSRSALSIGTLNRQFGTALGNRQPPVFND